MSQPEPATVYPVEEATQAPPAEPSTTTTTTTAAPPSTPAALNPLLVELTEVTVLVPDFPGRSSKNGARKTPAPSTPLPPPAERPEDPQLPPSGGMHPHETVEHDDVDIDTLIPHANDAATTPPSTSTGQFICISFAYFNELIQKKNRK
jgi:hypothetical protein